MGMLDLLFGLDNLLSDQDIASDLLKDSKYTVFSLSKAVSESSTPIIRQLLEEELMKAISQHHVLSDLTAEKHWYQPFLSPQEQVGEDFQTTTGL